MGLRGVYEGFRTDHLALTGRLASVDGVTSRLTLAPHGMVVVIVLLLFPEVHEDEDENETAATRMFCGGAR